MKSVGVIQAGTYAGQVYTLLGPGVFPRWYRVRLRDDNWNAAEREVREYQLEAE
jgi:hypothetical protein